MSAERWQRLIDLLAAADIDATVTACAYPGGVSRSIILRTERQLVTVHDQWWRKNDAVWIGWSVVTEDAKTSIVQREWPLTKKRSEVVTAVREALDDGDRRPR